MVLEGITFADGGCGAEIQMIDGRPGVAQQLEEELSSDSHLTMDDADADADA
eukprot:CAMPEP_0202468174 /NCGR_PEP_ID=MMETSP1360-20130828/74459_1 /ASSEMBLY_ACC=CAM_ASM_000848 /TAXON_ID=515479 /ORGANISM="Licmophora paradoxa, Strain CCMP2313" /LENGTH=51 /DNA_ID=CAMNT_0049093009 /DNA_START=1 /DNA_END=153 /DNA_ORIENTATION=+